MKKLFPILFLAAMVVLAAFIAGCGEGGSVYVNSSKPTVPAPEPAPVPTPALPGTITFGAVSDGFVELIFDSPLLQEHPDTESNKVVGLMDEAVQVGDILKVCWNGDIAGWDSSHCTDSVRQGNSFHGVISVPVGDEGNLVTYLIPTSKGSESWFNITKWTWPNGTVLDLNRGTAKLPIP